MCRRTCSGLIGVAAILAALAGCHDSGSASGDRSLSGRSTPHLSSANAAKMADANTAKAAGDYETALAAFQEILAENPTVTSAYLGIGEIYVAKEDYAKAEPAYEKAAKLEPRNFEAQYGHGFALQMLNRFVEAIRAYQRALTIDPDSSKANLNIATTYLQMSEPASALAFAEKAVQADPSNGSARINLGVSYERVGRNAQAIEQYMAAMELVDAKRTPPLMMNLINVLTAEKRYQEAANTAENLVKVEPSANAYERLGWCRFRLAEYDKSIAAYRAAVKIDSRHWESYNGIGVNALNTWLLSKKRDRAAETEAREAFRASLRINSGQQKLITLMSNYGL